MTTIIIFLCLLLFSYHFELSDIDEYYSTKMSQETHCSYNVHGINDSGLNIFKQQRVDTGVLRDSEVKGLHETLVTAVAAMHDRDITVLCKSQHIRIFWISSFN